MPNITEQDKALAENASAYFGTADDLEFIENFSKDIAQHREEAYRKGREDGLDWYDISTAPVGEPVLLYCPDRGCPTNPERIEYGMANNGNGSHHSWATKWARVTAPTEDK